jgi:hypothetical protein
MSFWANVVWKNILLGKRSIGKCLWANVFGQMSLGKCLWANVVGANVMETYQDSNKIRDNKCPHCEYASSEKGTLSVYIKAVHMKIRDHKFSYCDYMVFSKSSLTVYIKAVHDKII